MSSSLNTFLDERLPLPGIVACAIRLPDHRFRLEISEEVPAVRDAAGKVNVQATMQAVTNVVEGWIREHPEQWLWLHRRWR